MALSDFLLNLRIAARLRAPAIQTDSPGLETNALVRRLARAALWLTPRVVEEFNPDDFPNLTSEQRTDLIEGVNRFRAIALSVPPDQPASDAQFRQGREAFDKILQILGPYVSDPEGERILEILMSLNFPEFVVGLYCESEEDSSGESVFDIRVIVTDASAEQTNIFWHQMDEVRKSIDERLHAEGIQKWWNVSVCTKSELELLTPSDG